MEAPAPYSTPEAGVDLRELVAPVAAWLVKRRFQIMGCGPLAGSGQADLHALWHSPEGGLFHFELLAEAGRACCHLFETVDQRTHTCFAAVSVRTLREVRWLLLRSLQYRWAHRPMPGAALPVASPAPVEPKRLPTRPPA